MRLSVIVPVFNEAGTVEQILRKVLIAPEVEEVIVVDDGSTDGSQEAIERVRDPRIHFIQETRNRGKGWAVRRGINASSGNVVVIQDADLEYDPGDFKVLLDAKREEGVAVVYGNRFHAGNRGHSHLRYFLGGILVTFVTNMLYGLELHDEPVCYKLFDGDLIRRLRLRCEGFEFCPEVTAIVARLGYRIAERPIRYQPRKMSEGKKIRWKDGVLALWTLLKYRFLPKKGFFKRSEGKHRPGEAP